MLNTDQHNAGKKNKPTTQAQFINNLRGTDGGGHHDPDVMGEIHLAIRNDKFVMPAEQTGLALPGQAAAPEPDGRRDRRQGRALQGGAAQGEEGRGPDQFARGNKQISAKQESAYYPLQFQRTVNKIKMESQERTEQDLLVLTKKDKLFVFSHVNGKLNPVGSGAFPSDITSHSCCGRRII